MVAQGRANRPEDGHSLFDELAARVETTRLDEMERTLHRLPALNLGQQRLLDEMTTAIVESLLLQPLESAAAALDEVRLDALRDLFALNRD
jgi:glutamyl-tRNA reductase